MFYTYELLCMQRGGKFSCAYRAGTIGIKSVADKDLDNINVVELCQEIDVMITTKSMKVEDRLALRLSAILVNGLIRIFGAQVDKLYEQCGGEGGLAYGNLADIVPITSSGEEQFEGIISPELVIKKRQPRRLRKKPRTKAVPDMDEFRSPVASRQDTAKGVVPTVDVDDARIPKLPALLPQRGAIEIPLPIPFELDLQALQQYHRSPPSIDSSPLPDAQRNITIAVDVHRSVDYQPGEQRVVEPEAREAPDIIMADAAEPEIRTIDESAAQPDIQTIPDQIAMPPPESPRIIRRPKTPQPEGAASTHPVPRNQPRLINRNLGKYAMLIRPKRPVIDVSNLLVEELEPVPHMLSQEVEVDVEHPDEFRDAGSDVGIDQGSLGKIRTSHLSSLSLSHLEVSKSRSDSLVPLEEPVGMQVEGVTELQPILEEVPLEEPIVAPLEVLLAVPLPDVSKLSKSAQRLLKKLKLAPALRILIDDLCRKPIHKKEIVIVFQALLEIHANTNMVELVPKSDQDLYLDHILLK